MKIIVTNTQCKLDGPISIIEECHDKFKIRAKNAFWSPAFRKRQWDGFVRYVTKAGYFESGLLPKVYDYLKAEGYKVKLIDHRDSVEPDELITQVQDKVLRPYQLAAVKAVLENKIGKMSFQKVILKEATNAGKSLIAASIFLSYPEDTQWFFLVHRKKLHRQLVKEFKELLGSEVGVIDSDQFYLKRFNVCMVQTLHNRLKDPKVKAALAKATGCFADECHRAATGQYMEVLNYLYNCPIRVGLSGTIDAHKDKNKNEKVYTLFGKPVHTITNKEMIEEGYSTEPVVTILLGETRYSIKGDTNAEYNRVITRNPKTRRKIWGRVQRALGKKRYPLMIFCKRIKHAENLLKYAPEEVKAKYKLGIIHSDIPDGKANKTLDAFVVGDIDILIATHLIHEGLNMPLIKYALNCGGSDSEIVINQWLGRMLRKHKSKKKVYIEDIFYMGYYQRRHSKHRVLFYKKQGYKVIEQHKKTAKRKGIRL